MSAVSVRQVIEELANRAVTRRIFRQPRLFALKKAGDDTAQAPIDLQIRNAGLPAPVERYQFAAARRWALDRTWPSLKIPLPVESGGFGRLIMIERSYERRKRQILPIAPGARIRVGGRHNTGAAPQAHYEKYDRAAILGWLVVRATTTMIRDGFAITRLVEAFRVRAGQRTTEPAPKTVV